MPLSVFISNITFFIKNNYNIKKPRNRNRIRFQSRSVIHPYLLFFHFRQSRQRQQNRRYKPKPAGVQRRQPVHVPQGHRPGTDIRQHGLRKGADSTEPGPRRAQVFQLVFIGYTPLSSLITTGSPSLPSDQLQKAR